MLRIVTGRSQKGSAKGNLFSLDIGVYDAASVDGLQMCGAVAFDDLLRYERIGEVQVSSEAGSSAGEMHLAPAFGCSDACVWLAPLDEERIGAWTWKPPANWPASQCGTLGLWRAWQSCCRSRSQAGSLLFRPLRTRSDGSAAVVSGCGTGLAAPKRRWVWAFDDVLCIFPANRQVLEYNLEHMVALDEPCVAIKATNISPDAHTVSSNDTGNLHNNLSVCLGMQIMLMQNIWTPKGLVNGVLGTVRTLPRRQVRIITGIRRMYSLWSSTSMTVLAIMVHPLTVYRLMLYPSSDHHTTS